MAEDSGGGGKGAALASLIPGIGTFISGLFGNRSRSRDARLDREQQQRLFEANIAAEQARQQAQIEAENARQGRQLEADKAHQLQTTAFDESKLDPWRHQMSQVGDASQMDRLANSSYTPVSLTRGPNGIQRSGGASYTPDPQLLQAARAAAQMILSGRGRAPTMTDPTNYGQTGTSDLTQLDPQGNPRQKPRPEVSSPWTTY